MQRPTKLGDATIRSTDSAYGTAIQTKPEAKVKAYVDFSAFNKNYAEYIKKKQDQGKKNVASNEGPDQPNSGKLSEDWTLINGWSFHVHFTKWSAIFDYMLPIIQHVSRSQMQMVGDII